MQTQEKGQVIYLESSENLETMLNLDAPGKGRISFAIDSLGEPYVKYFNYLKDKSGVLLKLKHERVTIAFLKMV